ncbi:hypothetical protein NDU88_003161 [Pleurodeles waltl]|uniref:Uncharacterized protein n=1 Tax=Pleurodeles waltl TaxID=8319 RepID=A0AAV7T4C5_PLEWA|nr:hypothetical protein NDU88_003161 [Pleurodeles waltl]
MPLGYVRGHQRPLGYIRCLLSQPKRFLPGTEERRDTGWWEPFKAPGGEERGTPPAHYQKTLKKTTATLEEGKATQQPSLGCDDQEAARR